MMSPFLHNPESLVIICAFLCNDSNSWFIVLIVHFQAKSKGIILGSIARDQCKVFSICY